MRLVFMDHSDPLDRIELAKHVEEVQITTSEIRDAAAPSNALPIARAAGGGWWEHIESGRFFDEVRVVS